MVCTCWMFSKPQRAAQSAEVNWLPLSEVMAAGTPKRAIHPLKRACAQSAAAVVRSGTASAQRVVLSMTVNK